MEAGSCAVEADVRRRELVGHVAPEAALICRLKEEPSVDHRLYKIDWGRPNRSDFAVPRGMEDRRANLFLN